MLYFSERTDHTTFLFIFIISTFISNKCRNNLLFNNLFPINNPENSYFPKTKLIGLSQGRLIYSLFSFDVERQRSLSCLRFAKCILKATCMRIGSMPGLSPSESRFASTKTSEANQTKTRMKTSSV